MFSSSVFAFSCFSYTTTNTTYTDLPTLSLHDLLPISSVHILPLVLLTAMQQSMPGTNRRQIARISLSLPYQDENRTAPRQSSYALRLDSLRERPYRSSTA